MRSARSLLLSAEVGLAAVTLAAVLGMDRLFADGGWLGPLTVNAVAAHLLAAACRRRGVSLPITAAAMVVGAALVASWTGYWSTTAAGIPTGATWSTMGADLRGAWTLYQEVMAPAAVEAGFVLASAIALWCVAYVADWAAFRLWVPFEATLPAGTLFLFTALLGTATGRGWAVALYAAAVLGFLLLHRMVRQDGSSHWVADGRAEGHRSLLTVGATLGLVAVIGGTMFGPSLPGADARGLIDPRSFRNDPARQTVSPLVSMQTRLVDQSADEMFQVRSSQPSYWRLTSLDDFDGTQWTVKGSFKEAKGELPSSVSADIARETFEQEFEITGLAAIWLPAAYEPRSLDVSETTVRYRKESATLIVDNDVPSSDGLTYTITSSSPRLTAADLAGTTAEVPEEIAERYTALPDSLSSDVEALAGRLTETAATPYDMALALQNHLRTFTYDLHVGRGHSSDALHSFLFTTQRGYCEQFAGAFAAMARSVGLPARVAVGFTPGEVDPGDPTLYRVRGEHAHAWPEVYLSGAGWVAFEPTPPRGMPFAEPYTGVTPAQAVTGDPLGTAVAPIPEPGDGVPVEPSDPGGPLLDDGRVETSLGGGSASGERSDPLVVQYIVRPLAWVALGLVAAAFLFVIVVPLLLLVRWRLRRRRASTPADRIELAWTESVETASVLGYVEVLSDTVNERAVRLAAVLAPDQASLVRGLAHQLELATYSGEPLDDAAAAAADATATEIKRSVRHRAAWTARVQRWLDPRPHLRQLGRDRALRQRRITTTVRGDLEVERELVGSGDRR
ncbi:MAG: DUF3488 and transglutaminase-like domain-containing protein [Acidimicrobiales bacterium]